MAIFLSCLLAIIVVFGTTLLHYEAIRRMDRYARSHPRGAYFSLLAVITGLIFLHLVEIGLYASFFALADGPLDLGSFRNAPVMAPLDYFYFAAESYASLGYGDVYPTGAMRLIGSIAPLNGLLLLTWSGSFLFALVEEWRTKSD